MNLPTCRSWFDQRKFPPTILPYGHLAQYNAEVLALFGFFLLEEFIHDIKKLATGLTLSILNPFLQYYILLFCNILTYKSPSWKDDNFQRCLNLLNSVAVLWHQSADPLGAIIYKICLNSLLDRQTLTKVLQAVVIKMYCHIHPNSNRFSNWRKTCHVSWVKTHLLPRANKPH